MDREQMVRESERAAIARWFPPSPMGTLFDPGDGRLLRIREQDVPGWKEQGFALIDTFLRDSRMAAWMHALLFVMVMAIALLVADMAGIRSGAAIFAGAGLGLAVFHGWPLYQLWRFRRGLAALRARIRASLAASIPLPAEMAGRYRRRNPWRVVLHVWVAALIVGALGVQHFMEPDEIPVALVNGALAAVAIAWGLYFLSRRVDRQLQD